MRNPVLATQHGYTEFALTRAGPRHWFLDIIQASLRLQTWISNSEFIQMHKSKSILEVSHVKKNPQIFLELYYLCHSCVTPVYAILAYLVYNYFTLVHKYNSCI